MAISIVNIGNNNFLQNPPHCLNSSRPSDPRINSRKGPWMSLGTTNRPCSVSWCEDQCLVGVESVVPESQDRWPPASSLLCTHLLDLRALRAGAGIIATKNLGKLKGVAGDDAMQVQHPRFVAAKGSESGSGHSCQQSKTGHTICVWT